MQDQARDGWPTIAARLVSIIFHPLFMPMAGFYLLFAMLPYHFTGSYYILIVGLTLLFNTIFLPGYFIWLLKKKGTITSYYLPSQAERKYPLLFEAISLTVNYYFFRKSGLPAVLQSYLLAAVAVSVFALLANLWFKISLHGLGIGSLLGLSLVSPSFTHSDYRWLIWLLVLGCGIIGSARILLKAHHPSEVYSGILSGATLMWLSMYLQLH